MKSFRRFPDHVVAKTAKNSSFFAIVIFGSLMSHAESLYRYDDTNNCDLKVFDGKSWVPADGFAVEGQKFKAKPFEKGKPNFSAAFIDGSWYSVDQKCLVEVEVIPDSKPLETKKALIPKAKTGPTQSKTASHFGIELGGQYHYSLSKDVKARSGALSGSTVSLSAMSGMVGFGGRFFYRKNSNELSLGVLSASGKQTGTNAGGGIEIRYRVLDLSLGYRRYWMEGGFQPFVSAQLGYSMLNYDRTLTGSIANRVQASGTGIGYGAGLGARIEFSKQWSLVSELRYLYFVSSDLKVNSSDVTASPVGSSAGSLDLTNLSGLISLRFEF